jgi:Tfp pilus assembly protein PilE
MGQQQLLLVILVTIIVGIATVVAINIFGTAAEQANQDAVRQDLLAAAAQAQGIHARPVMMGGSGGDFTDDTTLPNDNFSERLGIPGTVNGLIISNENAQYTITRTGANTLDISADPTGSPGTWTLELTQNTDGEWVTTITDNDNLETIIGTPDST